MARKTTLTAKNLEGLGASRLADLLIEISAGDAAAKRRLRLALASAAGPEETARQVRKRLRTIANSRGFVDWSRVRNLAADLDTQRQAIVDDIAAADASLALDLLWEFMEMASSVFDRCDDSNGVVDDVFETACADLGRVAAKVRPDPCSLAERVCAAMQNNDYCEYDELIEHLHPALGKPGLIHLRSLLEDLHAEPEPEDDEAELTVIGWSPDGPLYLNQLSSGLRKQMIETSLESVADALGDVDGYIKLQDPATLCDRDVAVEIARRLLKAGRADEALSALDAADEETPLFDSGDWVYARIDVLDALGRHDEAQAMRWSRFESDLDDEALRSYLKPLPDFDDVETEQRALDFAMDYPDPLASLEFLVQWPALDRAARLVEGRLEELSGDVYEVLSPAADALEAKYPLSATLLRRAMIDFALVNGRSKRYGYAARHLMQCDGLSAAIPDFGRFPKHATYRTQLKADHGRKWSFWEKVK